jgi:hypothetical protein
MLQRIQTVYLLISAILIGLLFALPIAEIANGTDIYEFSLNGITSNGAKPKARFRLQFWLA